MTRRKSSEEQQPAKELDLHDLIKGTNIQIVSESSGVMHDRPKVATPLPMLNCLFGGGIPLSILAELYGEPTSGKSSLSYQTMGIFQRQYPEGVSVVVDTEASVDATRLPYMGVDNSRTLRLPATTLEDGFAQLFELLKKKGSSPELAKLPVFIIYDTIAIQSTQAQMDTLNVNGAGMMIKPRLLKHYLSLLMPFIENQPIICLLLNQVTTRMTQFGGKQDSSGGYALKHDIHLRLKFSSGGTEYDGVFAKKKYSGLSIEKSKISPLMGNFNIVLDIARGGVIDSAESTINYAAEQLGILNHASWSDARKLAEAYPEYVGKFGKFLGQQSFRWSELVDYVHENPAYVKLLQLAFLDMIEKNYTYQGAICKDYRAKIKSELDDTLGMNDNHIVETSDGIEVDSESGEIIESSADEITAGNYEDQLTSEGDEVSTNNDSDVEEDNKSTNDDGDSSTENSQE